MKTKTSIFKSLRLGILIIIGIIIYAYGFNVTNVNFVKTREEERLTQLYRILRALAHPNVVEYEKEELIIEAPIYLPCPVDGVPDIVTNNDEPYVVITPPCGEAKDFLKVEGFNFWPDTLGPLFFIPPSLISFQVGNFTVDSDGYFKTKIQLPNRQPVEEAQILRAIARRNIGSPRFTDMTISSWEKIVETVFLALLATTFGTMLAIPISFLAARNLMAHIKIPLTSAALAMLGWPLGIFIGMQVLKWVRLILEPWVDNFLYLFIGLSISLLVGFVVSRLEMPEKEGGERNIYMRILSLMSFVILFLAAIFLLNFLAYMITNFGTLLSSSFESLSYIGNFIFQLGDMLHILVPVIVALGFGSVIGNVGKQFGQVVSDKLKSGQVKLFNVILAPLSGAVLMVLLGATYDWFYQLEDVAKTVYWPAGLGFVIGLFLAVTYAPKKTVGTGIIIYYITRGVLNSIRSIEPLIMVIVAVVWVGIGPFAGALALGLHTIAALAKLFSEQVENIASGPLEALQATGANRLQTIIYAVVPQIIPPYISFTMYRWDINVRMSTIIGFAGGGGIGFLLSQNIKLFAYRNASVQMLFIAIVVSLMDYISAKIRERFV